MRSYKYQCELETMIVNGLINYWLGISVCIVSWEYQCVLWVVHVNVYQ